VPVAAAAAVSPLPETRTTAPTGEPFLTPSLLVVWAASLLPEQTDPAHHQLLEVEAAAAAAE
jgi:hypothetical protein